MANLTTEILTNLEKNGYAIAKIEWTGELHAPSLTENASVKPSIASVKPSIIKEQKN